MSQRRFEDVIRYHEETKHHYHRYARSPGHMDWENQPNPFRFYTGSPPIKLPFLAKDPVAGHTDLYRRENNPPCEFVLENIARFMELSLGLSAWKALAESKWSLRINPSSGNLHPTEAYLGLPERLSLKSGLYHYNPFIHALEQRTLFPTGLWQKIICHFKTDGFLIALSSIFWRESWKYGERAFRYCNHDIGHALACLSFSSNLFGWKVKYLNTLSDMQLDTILGFDRTTFPDLENEHPQLLCFVYSNSKGNLPRGLTSEIIAAFSTLTFTGKPNRLSPAPVDWELIYKTADLTSKPETTETAYAYTNKAYKNTVTSRLSAAEIIRKRRSAVDFNPDGFITRDQFFTMLDKTLPRDNHPPFDVEIFRPCVDLLIFVHAVRNLEQGLYLFLREDRRFSEIKRQTRPSFIWRQVEEKFSLYFLKGKDYRRDARIVSCDQNIAGSSAFSLGMIARFREVIKKNPFRYRHLFWETGMIGQVLYLEAEAYGLRGTGIGCFFDDDVHDIMGLQTNAYQSLYHFTIGEPIEDPRLQTYPPYHHIEAAGQ